MLEEFTAHMRRRKLSPATIKLRLFYLRKLTQHCDIMTADQATVEAFLELYSERSEQTQQSVLASVRAFYGWAEKKRHRLVNPVEDVPNLRVTKRPGRIASDFVIRSALSRATLQQQAMLMLGAECGLRVSEIANLNRRDRHGMWIVVKGKGGKVRELRLSPELAAVLDEIERHGMRARNYFPGRDPRFPVHPSTVWRQIKSVAGVNAHSLRHRAGTTVYRRGGKDIRQTQVFLGHASPATTAIYVHVDRDDLTLASEASRLAA